MSDTADARGPGARFEELVALIARLRGPGGCPWDREQTHESLKPMTIEEAYEVLEAIDDGDDAHLAGELGDLLLQVVFHSQMAAEGGRFTIADVVDRINEKMVRRHPHVFGQDARPHREAGWPSPTSNEAGAAATSGEVLRNWEALKEAERAAQGKAAPDESMLDSVSARLPAAMEAYQMATKVGRVGFDWPDAAAVLEKLDEEVAELKEAARAPADHRRVVDEVSDLLFVTVNVARLLGVDPESALKAANRKFRRRFRHVEARLREHGRRPAEATLAEMEALWQEAKERERA